MTVVANRTAIIPTDHLALSDLEPRAPLRPSARARPPARRCRRRAEAAGRVEDQCAPCRVAATFALAIDVPGPRKVGDDALRRALRDVQKARDVSHEDAWIVRDQEQRPRRDSSRIRTPAPCAECLAVVI